MAKLALVVWASWTLTAVYLFISSYASAEIITLYVAYMLFGALLLIANRRDMLSPPSLFTLSGFLAFGLNLPIFHAGNPRIETSDKTSIILTDHLLFEVLIVFLIAKIGFLLGYFSSFHKFIPLRNFLTTKPHPRKVSIATFFMLTIIIAGAAALRNTFHLGEVGIQPTIPYAGYFQYILFGGPLLFCIWFLAQGLRQGRIYLLLGLSLLIELALSQAFLGWKSGIVQAIYISVILFWYQIEDPMKRRPYSLLWLLLLIMFAGTIIQVGHEIRTERLGRMGGNKEYAKSGHDFIQKIADRSQGTTRLAAVIDHFGELTPFNKFLIKDLVTQGISTTQFIDRSVFSQDPRESNSFGTSGPGGPYTAMGMVGVLGSYFFLGVIYRRVYRYIFLTNKNNNILAIVCYAYLSFTLSTLLSENFSFGFLKEMAALFSGIYLLKFFIMKKINTVKTKKQVTTPAPSIASKSIFYAKNDVHK